MSDRLQKDAGKAARQSVMSVSPRTRYFVARGKVKTGPFSLAQLQAAARDGTLRAADMVLPEGTQKWLAAKEVPGIFSAAPNADPKSAAAPPSRLPSLFISHRRADSPDTVKLIHERLRQRLPRWEIFYDHESISLGDKFPERLREKVTSATAVLVIIGPKWLTILRERKGVGIDHVREEVRLALEGGKCVIPVPAGHAAMPIAADIADFPDLQPLLQRHGQSVRPDPDFNSDLERIIAFLKPLDTRIAVGTILDDKYTLTKEIGEGGMGVVYSAQQKRPVSRMVAVKLIKPGMDTKDILTRFDAERQALAVMDHPNIARVLDAGRTDSGRPYFAMEYVRGLPITQYCDDEKLTPQQRLNLFIPVCNAVQHAHQKAIIHRDLKPSNVLVEVVDGKAVPKVIDFGLAKAMGHQLTDKSQGPTLPGTRVGTLEYSAPEQAAGSLNIDARSDIYSLGVLLYELLTGAPPFTREELLKVGEEEMRRVIREVEPTTPSKKLSTSGELPAIAAKRHLEPGKLTRLVQGDLDWIVMKCLEKDRTRRYETSRMLGEELRRFLAGEPVGAGPPSLRRRVGNLLHQNKGATLASSVVLLLLMVGAIAGGVGFFIPRQEKQPPPNQVGAPNQVGVPETEDHFAKGEALFRAEQWRESIASFGKALKQDPANSEAYFYRGVAFIKVADYEKGVADLAKVSSDCPRFSDASLYRTQATALLFEIDVAPFAEAMKFSNALGLLENHVAKKGIKLSILVDKGAFEALSFADSPDIYDEEVKCPPIAKSVKVHRLLKMLLSQVARGEADVVVYPDFVAIEPRLPEPGDASYLAYLSPMVFRDDGVQIIEKALPRMKAKLGPDHRDTLAVMISLAGAYQFAGQTAKALAIYEETLATMKAKLGPDDVDTLNAMTGLAFAYQADGQPAKALPLLEETLAKLKTKRGPDHLETLICMNNLALAYQQGVQLAKALPLFEEAAAKMKTKLGLESPNTLSCLRNLALAYLADKQPAKAVNLFNEFLDTRRKQSGGDNTPFAFELAVTSLELLKHEQHSAAEPMLRECLGIRTKKEPDLWTTFNTKSMLGGALLGQKKKEKHKEAEDLLKEGYAGMRQREKTIPPEAKVRLTEALERLVQLYEATGNAAEAERLRKELAARKAAEKEPKK